MATVFLKENPFYYSAEGSVFIKEEINIKKEITEYLMCCYSEQELIEQNKINEIISKLNSLESIDDILNILDVDVDVKDVNINDCIDTSLISNQREDEGVYDYSYFSNIVKEILNMWDLELYVVSKTVRRHTYYDCVLIDWNAQKLITKNRIKNIFNN